MTVLLEAPVFAPAEQAVLDRIRETVVPGRTCGTCSLCCKVMLIPELEKPAGTWCQHHKQGAGCGIHSARPYVCRGAYCEWMLAKGLGPEWKPERSKFALFRTNGGRRITAHVDPGFPGAWKRAPYYEQLKKWSAWGLQQRPDMHIVDVVIGTRSIVLLPDREVEIGMISGGETVRLDRHGSGPTERIEVYKVQQRAEVMPLPPA
jgi:hypothetical protein